MLLIQTECSCNWDQMSSDAYFMSGAYFHEEQTSDESCVIWFYFQILHFYYRAHQNDQILGFVLSFLLFL